MKTVRKLFLVGVPILILGIVIFLFLTRSKPVVFRIPKEGTIRPRHYCLLNPFRDKGPEIVAAGYLNQLRVGQVQSISCCVGESKYVLDEEKHWPIESWRLGNRTDSPGSSNIVYWVERGNGYSQRYGEEEVHMTVVRAANGWELQSFSAVY
jgi:hypothetical protein